MSGSDPVPDHLNILRRTQILDAATNVSAEKGFHGATIKDIAVHAGIADGTIYNYFANKNALLIGILDRQNQAEQREAHFAHVAEHFFQSRIDQGELHPVDMPLMVQTLMECF